MSSGWVTVVIVGITLMMALLALGAALLRALWAQKERESLNSSDLRALEESTFSLIEQLRTEAQEQAAELDSRCERLAKLIEEADARISALQSLPAPELTPSNGGRKKARPSRVALDPRSRQVVDMAAQGMDVAEIAKQSGMSCAEINLLLRLTGAATD